MCPGGAGRRDDQTQSAVPSTSATARTVSPGRSVAGGERRSDLAVALAHAYLTIVELIDGRRRACCRSAGCGRSRCAGRADDRQHYRGDRQSPAPPWSRQGWGRGQRRRCTTDNRRGVRGSGVCGSGVRGSGALGDADSGRCFGGRVDGAPRVSGRGSCRAGSRRSDGPTAVRPMHEQRCQRHPRRRAGPSRAASTSSCQRAIVGGRAAGWWARRRRASASQVRSRWPRCGRPVARGGTRWGARR